DPHRNPHAHTRLPREQRDALNTYIRVGAALNRLLQATDNGTAERLETMRAAIGPGLLLFDLGRDGRFPTLDDL
ncbi:hypothetical protein, partial [Nocardiopsis sp. LOL_012]|uniref:hypothetical protein n=1 Tax=Nocardiopsis sp. LOL_012 TaxID=3345409 RepID=UPI003A8A4B4C